MLAIAESQLPTSARFVNIELQKLFPDRSIESIKGIRNKKEGYKIILRQIKDSVPRDIGSPPRILPSPSLNTNGSPSLPRRLRRRLPPTPTDDHTIMSEVASVSIVEADEFETSIRSSYECNHHLKSLIDPILAGSNDMTEINTYFSKEHVQTYKSNRGRPNPDSVKFKRKVKLRRYARFQQMFRRNKRNLASMLINDTEESDIYPSVDSIRNTYGALYESISPCDDEDIKVFKTSKRIFYPISHIELKTELSTMHASAPGIDNVDLKYLRSLSSDYLSTILNLQLWKSKQLDCLKSNKTTLIPKKNDELHLASNWRPITLSSMFVRLLHRILANRLSAAVKLNPRQKAFVPVDGCAQNTLILDTLICDARRKHSNLHVLDIDLSKAFDSISINSIKRALRRFSVEEPIINYIIDSYTGATTNIRCGPNSLNNIRIRRGVKQEDPLSPILFNLILDELLDDLPSEIGAPIGDTRLNCLAFADDIILLSESVIGMKNLIKHTSDFFERRSMNINAKKCFALSLTTSIRDRPPSVSKEPLFRISNALLSQTTYDGFFKYLGINFNPHCKMKPNIEEFGAILQRVRRSCLKPHQKVEILRNHVMPKFLHRLVLGRITKGLLQSFDSQLRSTIHDILDLPVDIPVDFFMHGQAKAVWVYQTSYSLCRGRP